MARLLAPGGHLVLETGNVAELPADEAGELELPDHLYHFSEANLRSLLADAGLEVLDAHRFVLLDQLPAVRRVKALVERSIPRSAPATPVADAELHLPRSRLGKRLAAHVATLGRYGAGKLLPKAGRRCTLVVVSRKASAGTYTSSSAALPNAKSPWP